MNYVSLRRKDSFDSRYSVALLSAHVGKAQWPGTLDSGFHGS